MTPPGDITRPTAPVVEIFSGIQGEGIYAGRRHLFLRLAGCDLACDYCDQPEARRPPRRARIETKPGQRNWRRPANPMSVETVSAALCRLLQPPGLHHALSLTGGEPLLHPAFLAELLATLPAPPPVLLETNGTRATALRALLPYLDIVSMDIKLRSTTGRPMPLKRHRAFLEVARRVRSLYVKAVVCSATTIREVRTAARLVAHTAPHAPLVLQPVTPARRHRLKPPAPGLLLELQAAALERVEDVRVMPQMHRILGQR